MEDSIDGFSHMDELTKLCRFCLKPHLGMRFLDPDALQASNIPDMFETITATKMEMSPLYSIFVCNVCVSQMHLLVQIRSDFIRSDHVWKVLISKLDKAKLSSNDEQISIKDEPVDDMPGDSLEESTSMDSNVEEKSNQPETDDQVSSSATTQTGDFEDDQQESTDCDYKPSESSEDSDEEDSKALITFVKRQRGRPKKTEVLICDICGAEAHSRYLLMQHMNKLHGVSKSSKPTPTTTCPICGKENLKRMAQHLRDHRKQDKYKCRHCAKTFNRHGMMLQHERQHTGERPFICEMCGFSFTSHAALTRHCKMHSLPFSNNKKYQKVQKTNRLLTIQSKPIPKLPPHQGVRPECPICHNTYVNRMSIHRHMKLQHGIKGMAVWKQIIETTCMVCNAKFATKDELMQHKPVHIEHQCTICRRRFHSKITLDLHVESHSKKDRPYKCDVCEAAYPSSFTLKIHFRRAHTDERPFKCTHCDHGFVERSVLNAHIRKVHSIIGQLKPHKCSRCPEAFRSKDALRSHVEKHTGKYRYSCGLCQRNLHSGPQLAEHERIYHPEKLSSAGGESTITGPPKQSNIE